MLDNLVHSPRASAPGSGSAAPAGLQRRIRPTALVVGVLGFVLSVAGSWIPSFWGDEAASVMSAERPLPSLFVMLGNVDAVHGSYYFMMHFWVQAFGASPLSMRLPSAVAIGFAAAGTVVLAHRLAGYRAAVFAAVVVLLLPRLTYVGEEARSYAFTAMFAVWLTVLLVVLLERGARADTISGTNAGASRQRAGWVLYAVLAAASAYMFLFSLLIVVAHGVIVLASRPHRRMLRSWLIASGAAVLLAGPVIVWGFIERHQISYLSNRDAAAFGVWTVEQWFGNPVYAALAWGVLLTSVVVGVRGWRSRHPNTVAEQSGLLARLAPTTPRTALVAGSVAFVPMAILLAVNVFYPVYTDRYLAMNAPVVALLIGWSLSLVSARRLGVGLLVVLTLAAIPTYVSQRTPFAKNESDWAQIADTVQDHATVGDAVVFDEAVQPSRRPRLAMHTYPEAFEGLRDLTLKVPFTNNTWWWDRAYKVGTVAGRFTGVQRVWLIEYHLPGQAADAYGMASLRSLGYRVQQSWAGHRSVVYELSRGA